MSGQLVSWSPWPLASAAISIAVGSHCGQGSERAGWMASSQPKPIGNFIDTMHFRRSVPMEQAGELLADQLWSLTGLGLGIRPQGLYRQALIGGRSTSQDAPSALWWQNALRQGTNSGQDWNEIPSSVIHHYPSLDARIVNVKMGTCLFVKGSTWQTTRPKIDTHKKHLCKAYTPLLSHCCDTKVQLLSSDVHNDLVTVAMHCLFYLLRHTTTLTNDTLI